MEKKPASGGMPASARVATRKVQKVTGSFDFRPPILRMSCSPLMAWITAPDPRKRQALKKAWVKTWNIPAAYAPTPHARNMYPSCETVEYASTFLISVWATAMTAAKMAVTAPIRATTSHANGASRKRTLHRATM